MSSSEVYVPESTGRRVSADELRELFRVSGIMAGVSGAALAAMAAAAEVVHVPGGERIMAQGRIPSCSYTIVHGRVRGMRSDAAGRCILSGEFGRGDSMGFGSFVIDVPSYGDAYTVRDCTLLRFTREGVEAVLERHPEVMRVIARAMARSAHQTVVGADAPSRAVVNVAVLPLGSHPATEHAATAFSQASGGALAAARLTAADARAALGEDALAEDKRDRLIRWFYDQETRRDLVLFACDPARTPWTEICLRQADRVLMVAPAVASPRAHEALAVLDERAGAPRPDVDLLLFHERDVELPVGTSAWLNVADFARVNHVRVDRAADFERVARRLTGRAVGVVLGGGGARGIAHVGVLQAIHEAGIAIDYVGGASMGSIFAAGWARGWPPEKMLAKVREVFAPKRALLDLTFPFVAVLRGTKVERVLRYLFAGLSCEDLWTPFFCTSTNLTHPGVRVHQRGPLWKAIRASASMPGIFPPMHDSGELLVDGGVLDNLPVETGIQLCDGGPVIAVDVSEASLTDVDESYVASVSGWRLLGRKLNPFSRPPRIPNLLELITQSTLVASRHVQERAVSQAALYLKPPVGGFGTMQFDAHEELYRIGYEYAREVLSQGVWPPPDGLAESPAIQ